MGREYKIYGLVKEDKIIYIGSTCKKYMSSRMHQHRRVGKVFDSYKILCRCLTKEESNKLEKKYIEIHDTFHNGLNKTENGLGRFIGNLNPTRTTRVYNDKGFDKVYDSLMDACRELELNHSHLSEVARGEGGRKQHMGYKAEYIKKEVK